MKTIFRRVFSVLIGIIAIGSVVANFLPYHNSYYIFLGAVGLTTVILGLIGIRERWI